MKIDISVIVTTHTDTEPYIEECLKSVEDQTIPPHEVIVVVDGYKRPMIYPGVKTIIRDVNRGVSYSRDEGVKLATGNYLLFVDGDDVLAENFIEEMEAAVREHKADITYSNAIIWSAWGDSKLKNGYFNPPFNITFKDIIKRNYVLVTSVMSRSVYLELGGFDPDLPIFEDYKFFLEAFLRGYTFYKANCVLKYRQRTESRNRTNDAEKKRIYEKIKRDVIGSL